MKYVELGIALEACLLSPTLWCFFLAWLAASGRQWHFVQPLRMEWLAWCPGVDFALVFTCLVFTLSWC
jgi:hypothetical protein